MMYVFALAGHSPSLTHPFCRPLDLWIRRRTLCLAQVQGGYNTGATTSPNSNVKWGGVYKLGRLSLPQYCLLHKFKFCIIMSRSSHLDSRISDALVGVLHQLNLISHECSLSPPCEAAATTPVCCLVIV